MDKEEMIRRAVEADMEHHIKQAFAKFGIEGTEDKLKEAYKNHPTLLKQYLKVYRRAISESR